MAFGRGLIAVQAAVDVKCHIRTAVDANDAENAAAFAKVRSSFSKKTLLRKQVLQMLPGTALPPLAPLLGVGRSPRLAPLALRHMCSIGIPSLRLVALQALRQQARRMLHRRPRTQSQRSRSALSHVELKADV
jgi:hypothetical protein